MEKEVTFKFSAEGESNLLRVGSVKFNGREVALNDSHEGKGKGTVGKLYRLTWAAYGSGTYKLNLTNAEWVPGKDAAAVSSVTGIVMPSDGSDLGAWVYVRVK